MALDRTRLDVLTHRFTVKTPTLRAVSMRLTMGAVVALTAQDVFTPARYLAGPLPTVPIQAVGGGEVFLEVALSENGRVSRVTPLRITPPFVDPLLVVIQQWQFRPAEEEDSASRNPKLRQPVESKVLVAGLFRPPALDTPTLGTLPIDVAPGSDEIPHPTKTVAPPYPPAALFSGIVLVEVEIAPTGMVAKTTVVRSAPPFDTPAVDAARQWTFRPVRRQGRPVAGVAYVVFGFQQPVTAPRQR